jgi:NADPH-dependent glutamate synthase beta subunit-like oxidoreductase
VAIRRLKEFLAADSQQRKGRNPEGKPNQGKRVAVVGAGPTGLAAAHDLAQMGYQVTVFETLPVPGGMLWVGIPEFRLPRRILKKEIDTILDGGVELRTRQALGQDFSLNDLRKQGFQAFLIATGAHRSQCLRIEGEDLKGVLGGVEFLRRTNLGEDIPLGERVAVIGGGNVAIDSARSALRLGAKKVEIYYRRSRQEMPAIAEEVKQARREGVQIHWLKTPRAFVGNNGKVEGVIGLKNRLGPKDTSGRKVPVPIPGSEYRVAVDSVIVAVGQETGARDLRIGLNIRRDGTIPVRLRTGATSVPGIFAGGDVVTGPGWAIDAISWGKRAALGIHAYLSAS